MTSVLFAVAEAGEFVELRRLIPSLRKLGVGDIAFAFTYPGYKQLNEHFAWCSENKIACYDQLGRRMQRAGDPTPPQSVQTTGTGMRSHLRRLKGSPVDEAIAFARTLKGIRKKRNAARRIFDAFEPDVVVVGQCSAASDTHVLLEEARGRGIRTVLMPFAISHLRGQLEPLKGNRNFHARTSVANRIAARLYPEWKIEHEQKVLLRLPGAQILAHRLSGLSAARPWYPNSEGVDEFAADSERGRQRLVALGADPTRIKVTGGSIHDTLYEAHKDRVRRRHDLCRSAGIDPASPVIVCSWPSNQFLSHRGCDEFNSYHELSTAWAEALADVAHHHNVGVLVARHPKTAVEELAPAGDAGLSIIDTEIAFAIPLCDVMVGSVTSVIAWAIACGVPVVNYDVYRYRYGDYSDVPGVIEVEQIEHFRQALEQLCSDGSRRRELADAQHSIRESWGILDGSACTRIAGMIVGA